MRVIFSGGLGNQLFQYALYLALKEKGVKVKRELSLYSYVKMHNGFEIDKIFNVEDKNNSRKTVSKINSAFLRIIIKTNPLGLLLKDTNNFVALNSIINSNYKWIYGYWQSEKYFSDCEGSIRQNFTFVNIDAENKKIAKTISNSNSVSLHIRRGDYVNNDIYDHICDERYYKKAIAYILDKIEMPIFYVFSNDIEWAKKFLEQFPIQKVFMTINQAQKNYQDMYLMSCCKHNIIANSSFSWWGAWLNNNKSKIVIAPSIWMNNTETPDIIPETWIKLPK